MSEKTLSNESIAVIAILAVLLVLFSGGIGFGMSSMMSGMMGNYFFFSNPLSWLFNIVQSLLIIILLVLGIFWLIKKLNKEKEAKK